MGMSNHLLSWLTVISKYSASYPKFIWKHGRRCSVPVVICWISKKRGSFFFSEFALLTWESIFILVAFILNRCTREKARYTHFFNAITPLPNPPSAAFDVLDTIIVVLDTKSISGDIKAVKYFRSLQYFFPEKPYIP